MTLPTLERRIAEAKGADWEITRDLLRALFPDAEVTLGTGDGGRDEWKVRHLAVSIFYTDDPLESIDAALALVFRILTPLGFLSWGIDGTQKNYNVGWVAVENADSKLIEGRGESPTPALALCLALIRAVIAKEAGNG